MNARNLGPYPAYRDSGVEWLGDVPEHWRVLPNRALFVEASERGHAQERLLSVTIREGVIPQDWLLRDSSEKDSSRLDKSAYKLVREGDIAYNKMRAWQGAVGVSQHHGIVSPAYVVQRCRPSVNSKYFHHLFRTSSFAKEAERWSYGITSDMWSLRPEHFRLIHSCAPTSQEQAAIVRFLDYADRRIRRAIRAKEKLIALLEEQKQALIHDAVTGRTDVRTGQPYPAYKDSGVEWLGRVPEHWECDRLTDLVILVNGFPFDSTLFHPSAGVPLVRIRDLHSSTTEVNWAGDPVPQAEIHNGDILIGMDGDFSVAWWTHGRAFLNQRLCCVRANSTRIAQRWLFYCLPLPLKALNDVTHATTVKHLSSLDVLKFRVPSPPVSDQSTLSDFLDGETEKIAAISNRARDAIERLNEYRIRLIADVVTGKLDVREAAASLPDEDSPTAGEEGHEGL